MENEFNYNAVPNSYAHCFNRQCVKSNESMHGMGRQKFIE